MHGKEPRGRCTTARASEDVALRDNWQCSYSFLWPIGKNSHRTRADFCARWSIALKNASPNNHLKPICGDDSGMMVVQQGSGTSIQLAGTCEQRTNLQSQLSKPW